MIITIIVLLILAGVSISVVVGDNGVLSQAQEASVKTNKANAQEAIEIAMVSINSGFIGDVRTSNANAKMNEYATYGELSKQIKNNGYEVKINGASVNDNNDTKLVGGELVSLNKAGSENKYVYTVAVTDDDISAVSWTFIPDETHTSLSLGVEVENSKGEKFNVIAIDSTNNKVTLLSKYNLNQAGTAQAPNADLGDTLCSFSSTNYWETAWNTWNSGSKATLLDLNGVSGNVAGDAVTKAKDYGAANGGVGRLLTFEEVDSNADFNVDSGTVHDIFCRTDNTPQNYWLGSAIGGNADRVWYVSVGRGFLYNNSFYSGYAGVRPVITISKSAVQ